MYIHTICSCHSIQYILYIYEKFKAAKKGLADWPGSFDAKVRNILPLENLGEVLDLLGGPYGEHSIL